MPGRTHYWIDSFTLAQAKPPPFIYAFDFTQLDYFNISHISSTQCFHTTSASSFIMCDYFEVLLCTHKYRGLFNCCQSVCSLINLLPSQLVLGLKGKAPESQIDFCVGGWGVCHTACKALCSHRCTDTGSTRPGLCLICAAVVTWMPPASNMQLS